MSDITFLFGLDLLKPFFQFFKSCSWRGKIVFHVELNKILSEGILGLKKFFELVKL